MDLQQKAEGSQKQGILMEQIQKGTKESIRRKPFCLAISMAWLANPHRFSLELTYTKLEWMKRDTLPGGVVRREMCDITDLLDEKQLGTADPARILVTGKLGHPVRTKFWRCTLSFLSHLIHGQNRSMSNTKKVQKEIVLA